MKRGFWEYKEPDGTVTNFRVKWLVGAVIVGASLGLLVTLLAGCAAWLAVPAGAALTAAGTLIAFTIDYVHDNRSAGPGNEHQRRSGRNRRRENVPEEGRHPLGHDHGAHAPQVAGTIPAPDGSNGAGRTAEGAK